MDECKKEWNNIDVNVEWIEEWIIIYELEIQCMDQPTN